MIDKKVVVVATGGTIAMKYDPEKDGLVPACTGEDLAAAVPGLGEVAPLEFIQFSNIASPGMTPQNMWDLHLKLEEVLARDDVAGAIVTHGTDTLEETSYFLDLLHTSPKPIVTTAAMRGAGDTSPDGPMNIYCAVKTAASQEAVGMGVLVCLNETLHAPGEVMKTHSANPATFQSPWWGPIGYVDLDKIIIRRKPLNVLRFAPKSLTARVDLIKCMTGSTATTLTLPFLRAAKALSLRASAAAMFPHPWFPALKTQSKPALLSFSPRVRRAAAYLTSTVTQAV